MTTILNEISVVALPDGSYFGSLEDWKNKLKEKGIWDGLVDLKMLFIPAKDWLDVLEELEGSG